MKIPNNLRLDKWNRMSLTEQYETVFCSAKKPNLQMKVA